MRIAYIINESPIAFSESKIIKEDGVGTSSRVTATGRLQKGNEKNRNSRMYRTPDLAREIAAPRQLELLSTGNMLGEAGHPASKDLVRQQTIDPTNTCVRYLKFWMEGDDVMSTFKGTNNALGETFDRDLREGVLPAFSLRALGSIENTKEGAIVTGLKMITYDYVIFPSHPTAYTTGLVSESAVLNNTPVSNFNKNYKYRNAMNANNTLCEAFTNQDVIDRMNQLKNESAINYTKDYSKNYKLLKECFDLTNMVTMDINNGKMNIVEASGDTIVMDIDNYILKEIRDFSSNN